MVTSTKETEIAGVAIARAVMVKAGTKKAKKRKTTFFFLVSFSLSAQ